jgi:hypothetical protein
MILGVTCLRNEGPYVVDWIAHHLAAGFDHMLVLTHDCNDGSAELLDALSVDDRITHLPFKFTADKTVQWQALNIAKKHPLVKAADWVMFFDCDEYMNLPDGFDNLPALIATMPEAEAIAFPWRLFGAAGQEAYDTAPVTQRFRMCAPHGMNYPLSSLFKTLFKPTAFRQMGVHRPRNKKDQSAVWFASNGQRLTDQFAQQDKAISLMNAVRFDNSIAYMNHYSVRSAQEFMLKAQRGLPNHMDRKIDLSYWAERNFNVVEDTRIDRMMEVTDVVRETLLALPDVDLLHTGSCEEHKRRIGVLLDDLENVRLIWRLGLLASSAPPPVDRAMQYIKTQIRMKNYNG